MKYTSILTFMILLSLATFSYTQETTEFRVHNLTFDTFDPDVLQLNRGRLIWKDEPPGGGLKNLWLYTGAEMVKLDSGLIDFTAAIDGWYVAWNTADEEVKLCNLRDWSIATVGSSYNPDGSQPAVLHNGLLAYARRTGDGSQIVLHDLATDTDTTFSASAWNLQPSLHHGQLAWVAQESEGAGTPSDLYFFDGRKVENLTNKTTGQNIAPILRDGHIVWLEKDGDSEAVKYFNGNETVTLASPGENIVIRGYDLSGGIAVTGISDTLQQISQIIIFDSESGEITPLLENTAIATPHIDNGQVSWVIEGSEMRIKRYDIRTKVTTLLPSADAAILDDEQFAWTFGEAVEFGFPVTFKQLTDDSENGWEQTRFKNIDNGTAAWGDYENAVNMRLFFHDVSGTTQLTDSSETKDFVMNNDGYVIWRNNFDFLWLYDGNSAPRQVVDSLQLENPYVAGGSVGFFGFKLDDPNMTLHAWLYDINADTLMQLTEGDPAAWTVLCDGNTACWLDRNNEKFYYFDGSSVSVLSEGPVDFTYDYENGKIVWSELQNDVWQVMSYDVVTKIKEQLTQDSISSIRPQTDGENVVWYENSVYPLDPTEPLMVYYNVATGEQIKIARFYPETDFRLPQLSNGKIAWAQNNNIFVFDGQSIGAQTADDFRINTEVDIDDEMLLWKRTLTNPNRHGDIFFAKLRPKVAFDVHNLVGPAPLQVKFMNRSWHGVQSWEWDFGDGQSSTEKHPVHIYEEAGTYSVTLSVTGPTGTVKERKRNLVRISNAPTVVREAGQLPAKHTLFQNYPNPFNPATDVRFCLAPNSGADNDSRRVTLKIYDVLGREVVTLIDKELSTGVHTIRWDGTDALGLPVTSGMYLYRLETGDFVQTKKLLLLK